MTQISSSLAAILNATTPVFTVLAAHLRTANGKLRHGKALGVSCGVLGVVVLIGPAALADFGRGRTVTRVDDASWPDLMVDQVRHPRFESETRMVAIPVSGMPEQNGIEVVWERIGLR